MRGWGVVGCAVTGVKAGVGKQVVHTRTRPSPTLCPTLVPHTTCPTVACCCACCRVQEVLEVGRLFKFTLEFAGRGAGTRSVWGPVWRVRGRGKREGSNEQGRVQGRGQRRA